MYSALGPVTPLQILPKMESDDLYTIQNPNPKLQPNRPTQFLQQALPSLPYLDFQVGQAGQIYMVRLSWAIWLQLSRAIWLQFRIFILHGIEII